MRNLIETHDPFNTHSHMYDVQHGALYDMIELPPGGTLRPQETFFSTPHGKSLAQTNVYQSQRLDAPEQFRISRVVFTFGQSMADEDIYTIAEGAPWGLWLGQKKYLGGVIIALQTVKNVIAPIRICDFCHSVYCGDRTCPGCGARQFTISSLGGDTDTGMQFFLDLTVEISILSQQTFWVQFDHFNPITLTSAERGGRGLKLWCHLEGLHVRGYNEQTQISRTSP